MSEISEIMVERVAMAIAGADQEDYMEDYARYDRRAKAAIEAIYAPIEENIERVARALCLAQGHDPDGREILSIPSVVGRDSGTTPPTVMKAILARPRWESYTRDACAAIDAMLKG